MCTLFIQYLEITVAFDITGRKLLNFMPEDLFELVTDHFESDVIITAFKSCNQKLMDRLLITRSNTESGRAMYQPDS